MFWNNISPPALEKFLQFRPAVPRHQLQKFCFVGYQKAKGVLISKLVDSRGWGWTDKNSPIASRNPKKKSQKIFAKGFFGPRLKKNFPIKVPSPGTWIGKIFQVGDESEASWSPNRQRVEGGVSTSKVHQWAWGFQKKGEKILKKSFCPRLEKFF